MFTDRITKLVNTTQSGVLQGGLKGVEKESLRVTPEGRLSQEPHPSGLGSALTNRFITTDFSEALLEFVTPARPNTWETLRTLCDIHQFSYSRIGDEMLWVNSMPCQLPPDGEIPLARYGDSNVGRMKTIYRNGLGYRYGRNMQAIAGVHFNYSLPEHFWVQYQDQEGDNGDIDVFRSSGYLGLVRNFRRFGWLALYLFGASPAICKSFARGDELDMPTLDGETYYEPFGTSLRMSDLGYSNNNQASIKISLNDLDEYISDLRAAITTPEPAYMGIGTKVDGEYRQLSVNQLQIENEYYSAVRPKRVARSGEWPTAALRRGGIEYVEIRSLDLNVFDPVGINQNAMRFMEAFLIYCLLEDSPPLDDNGSAEASRNHTQTAVRGRDPDLELLRNGKKVLLTDWATEILANVTAVAEQIDQGSSEQCYLQAVRQQAALVEDSSTTPSARVLQELDENRVGFFAFAMEAARQHKEYFASLQPLQGDSLHQYETEARDSLERQQQIESSPESSLDDYLSDYFRTG